MHKDAASEQGKKRNQKRKAAIALHSIGLPGPLDSAKENSTMPFLAKWRRSTEVWLALQTWIPANRQSPRAPMARIGIRLHQTQLPWEAFRRSLRRQSLGSRGGGWQHPLGPHPSQVCSRAGIAQQT